MCWFVEKSDVDPVVGYANFFREHARRSGDSCAENSWANMVKGLRDINSWEAGFAILFFFFCEKNLSKKEFFLTKNKTGNNGAAGRAWTWQFRKKISFF